MSIQVAEGIDRLASSRRHGGFVHGGSSSTEVAGLRPAFAILPVGSCEQHGAHLPILTDTLTVERVVASVGERVGGLVLPTLPYGTSFEHLGFPGTMTLRWSTLAAIVADIADSCFRQGIGTLFVISGHGGNFILNPCVRELNSSLPPGHRLVLVPERVYLGDGSAAGDSDDVHAGLWETAIMLSLRPDLVTMTAAIDNVPSGATRADLTNRTLLSITGTGVWGRPLTATAEQGNTLFDSAVARVSDRKSVV